eukprot:SAG31_NODE_589_length_13808_cov_3.896710_14_plen_127_part_00
MSFDIDGDGTVSSQDFLLASRFDADGNGILDSQERATLQRVMAKEKVGNIMRMLSASRSRKVEELRGLWLGMDEDSNLDDTEQDAEDVMKMRLAFQVTLEQIAGQASCRLYSSSVHTGIHTGMDLP